MTKKEEDLFQSRLARHLDELRWLYMELYGNDAMFAELCDNLHRFAEERSAALKKRDLEREADPEWYKSNDLTGMMLYIDNFAGNLDGVQKKLPYIQQAGINMLHLMPFLDTVPERSDGGYAVADFRAVRPDLGTIEDLEALADACHKKGINLCMDFVMNHTSQDHEWAKKACRGGGEYMSRYFFFDNWNIPAKYETTVPQVFPTTAPGNFTWLDDCQHFVMTSFYPYQWDLNYRNPRVFNEMMYNFLFLANKGMDMIRIDAVPYIWKELGTDCRNRPQVHTIVRMMRMIGEIVCPSVILLGEVVMEPVKVVPYFGTVEKPECHLLYNVTTMCTTWHTVATQDTRLLRRQLDIVNSLPKEYVYTDKIMTNPNWTMAGIFADEGITGTSASKRPEFLRMIRKCRQKKIDLVLVKSISRFARNTVDCLNYMCALRELGIAIIFEEQNINTLESDGELLITLLGAVAQGESESISENVKWGKRQAMREGKAAIQYKRLYAYEKGEDGKPQIIPEQAEVVRRIYDSFLSGHSLRMIKDMLERESIPTVNGGSEWSISVVRGILQNEKYCGDVLQQKTFVNDCISRKHIRNVGQLPMYLTQNHHVHLVCPQVHAGQKAHPQDAGRACSIHRSPSGGESQRDVGAASHHPL